MGGKGIEGEKGKSWFDVGLAVAGVLFIAPLEKGNGLRLTSLFIGIMEREILTGWKHDLRFSSGWHGICFWLRHRVFFESVPYS